MPHLEDWSVVINPDTTPYTPPEYITNHLNGRCSDHPLHQGTSGIITTSRIFRFSAAKRMARTQSGTLYTLGEPATQWIAWLTSQGRTTADYDKGDPETLSDPPTPDTLPK